MRLAINQKSRKRIAKKYGGSFNTGNIQPVWDPANPNGKPTAANGFLTATVTFTNLPNSNSAFGVKTARLKRDGDVVATNKYAVFFDKFGANHPPCSTCAGCPNWFWYWREGDVCGIPKNGKCKYDSTLGAGVAGTTEPWGDGVIRLGPDASRTYSFPRSFQCTYDSVTYLDLSGIGRPGWGIDSIVSALRHEQEHLDIYATFKIRFGIIPRNPSDLDGDGLPLASEETYRGLKTDPGNADTYNLKSYHSDYSIYGDQELRARFMEQNDASPYKAYPERDWAHPGTNHRINYEPDEL